MTELDSQNVNVNNNQAKSLVGGKSEVIASPIVMEAVVGYCRSRVAARKMALARAVHDVAPVVQDVLKEIELHEPRFVSSLSLNRNTGRYEGLTVVGGVLVEPHGQQMAGSGELAGARFEVNLFLNQMGVFNFVDDGTSPGCSVLKLSDGRKRSMSLWVEFITASGYLSARKIRARFHALLLQACDKVESKFGHNDASPPVIKIISKSGAWTENRVGWDEGGIMANAEVTISLWGLYSVTIVPAFKCAGMWPRSANSWPLLNSASISHSQQSRIMGRSSNYGNHYHQSHNHAAPLWPSAEIVAQAKAEGFTLVSREPVPIRPPTQARLISETSLEDINLSPNKSDLNHSAPNNLNITNGVCLTPSNSIEGDTWLMVFTEAEDVLLKRGCRRTLYRVLKTLRDRHFDKIPGNPVTNYLLKTLLLFECDKHPLESEWEWGAGEYELEEAIVPPYDNYYKEQRSEKLFQAQNQSVGGNHGVVMVYRLTGILIQLISCLQCRKCPHYFLPCVDLLRDQDATTINRAALEAWKLLRQIIMDPVKCWAKL